MSKIGFKIWTGWDTDKIRSGNEWYRFKDNLAYISYDRKTYSWCATVKILRLFTGSRPRKVELTRGKNSNAPIGREKRELSTPRAEIGGKGSSQRAQYFINYFLVIKLFIGYKYNQKVSLETIATLPVDKTPKDSLE